MRKNIFILMAALFLKTSLALGMAPKEVFVSGTYDSSQILQGGCQTCRFEGRATLSPRNYGDRFVYEGEVIRAREDNPSFSEKVKLLLNLRFDDNGKYTVVQTIFRMTDVNVIGGVTVYGAYFNELPYNNLSTENKNSQFGFRWVQDLEIGGIEDYGSTDIAISFK